MQGKPQGLTLPREAPLPRVQTPGTAQWAEGSGEGGASPALLGRRTPREDWGSAPEPAPPPTSLPPATVEEQKLRRAAFVWHGCPGHALAWPAVSGNTRAARKASGPQLLPAHRLGASRPIPRNLWQKNPPSGTATHQRPSGSGKVSWDVVRRTPRYGPLLSEESLLLRFQPPLEMCVIPEAFTPCRQGKGCSTYHGEGFPGLLEQRFREQGDMYTLGDIHCPAIQVCDNNIQLEVAGQA